MNSPVLKWPGSKWTLAEWIIANLPKHDCYIEPFFGSGAVFFNKTPSNVETINDRDSLAINLFRVIRDNPDQLEAAIALTPWARSEYDVCRRDLAYGDDVERARRLLVATMWSGRAVCLWRCGKQWDCGALPRPMRRWPEAAGGVRAIRCTNRRWRLGRDCLNAFALRVRASWTLKSRTGPHWM